MGKLPLIERPTPVLDILRERPTLILEEPLVKRLDGEDILPPRGTGLLRGTAGERRLGFPRTLKERLERHKMLTK